MTWNPRDDVQVILDLVNIRDSTGADHGFLIGVDGSFADVNGKVWVGSRLLSVSRLQSAIDGIAPQGEARLSYVQEPGEPDLIAELRATGLDLIDGQAITFYYQPLLSVDEMHRPTLAPVQWLTRTMRTIEFTADGAQDRSISVGFEAWSEDRRAARRRVLSKAGHEAWLGESNPSLEFMPSTTFEEQKLFG